MPESNLTAIQLEHLGLKHTVFQRLGDRPKAGSPPPEVNFGLGARFLPAGELLVELTVELSHEDVVEATVTYLGVFSREEGEEPEPVEKLREEWRFFAAKVAPTVLYPYVRETLTTLALKSGLPALVVPIVNFAGVFDPADMALEVLEDPPEEED